MQFKFKENNSFEKRKAEATNIRSQHPDRVPVIIEKAPDSNIGNLDKNKFLVPQDITMSQLMYIIRKRIKLVEDKALFLSVNHTVPSTSITVGEVFDQHQDEDGFLYLTFRGESTFGC